jgi:hypothetical protein
MSTGLGRAKALKRMFLLQYQRLVRWTGFQARVRGEMDEAADFSPK